MDALIGVFPEELRKAETFVIEGVNEFAHRLDAPVQFALKLSQPRGGKIIVIESIVNCIRR